MTWEDDELNEYEKRRVRLAQENALSSQRLHLLETRHAHEWMALRTLIQKTCEDINERAGREILKSIDPVANNLLIRREDGEKLKAQYTPQTKKLTISCDAPPFSTQNYELTVRTIKGNDAVVWWNGKDMESAEDIAKLAVGNFLHAGML